MANSIINCMSPGLSMSSSSPMSKVKASSRALSALMLSESLCRESHALPILVKSCFTSEVQDASMVVIIL